MNLKQITQTLCASGLIALGSGCSENKSVSLAIPDQAAGAKSAQEGEGLPQNIIDAVNEAKPGNTIISAAMELEDGKNVYEVVVEADGERWEVEVSADGKVLEVEKDDDEADEGQDDDETDEADDDEDGDEEADEADTDNTDTTNAG